MKKGEKTTASAATRWRIVIYRYESSVPDGNDSTATRFIDDIGGVSSISIQKSKQSCTGTCTITITGDLNSAYFIGNWVVVRSRIGAFQDLNQVGFGWSQKGVSWLQGYPRFIGQITSVTTSYVKDASGNLRRQSRVTISEWSSILTVPIRYDIGAIQSAMKSENPTSNIGIGARGIVGKDGAKMLHEAQKSLAAATFNPWTYCGVILTFLDCLNSNTEQNLVGVIQGKANLESAKNFKEVCTKLPTIPTELLQDLAPRINGSPTQGGRIFDVGIGVQSEPLMGDSDATDYPQAFNGFFSSDIADELQSLYQPTDDRPITQFAFQEFTQGGMAWELLKTRTDPSITEVFTDIWSYQDNEGNVYGRPVLIVRDVPFALKRQLNSIKSSLKSKWTAYDDLGRVQIDADHIVAVHLESTFYGSPNYVVPQLRPGSINPGTEINDLYVNGTIRRPNEMSRFGGLRSDPETDYCSTNQLKKDGKIYIKGWYSDFSKVYQLWHCNNYLFLNGSMKIIDDGYPILIGHNITWRMGENVLCAQVESVSIEYNVLPDGRDQTTANIMFSHCCLVKTVMGAPQYGSLEYITPEDFNNLYDQKIGENAIDRLGESVLAGLMKLNQDLGLDNEAIEKIKQAKKLVDQGVRKARELANLIGLGG